MLPRKVMVSCGERLGPTLARRSRVILARSLCRVHASGLRSPRGGLQDQGRDLLPAQVFGPGTSRIPDQELKVGVAEPGAGVEPVGLFRELIGRLRLLEVRRLMGQGLVGPGQRGLAAPEGNDRPGERARQGRPDQGQRKARQAALDLAKPAARAILAEVQPQRDEQPEAERHALEADAAGGQQVDHHRQHRRAECGGGQRRPPPEPAPQQDGQRPARGQDQPADQEVVLKQVELAHEKDHRQPHPRREDQPAQTAWGPGRQGGGREWSMFPVKLVDRRRGPVRASVVARRGQPRGPAGSRTPGRGP